MPRRPWRCLEEEEEEEVSVTPLRKAVRVGGEVAGGARRRCPERREKEKERGLVKHWV
jgi:hypothetical protein